MFMMIIRTQVISEYIKRDILDKLYIGVDLKLLIKKFRGSCSAYVRHILKNSKGWWLGRKVG